ncbi:MAG: endonuclease III domain-containing protein [Candidatus Omnitrophota bacterium]
MSNRFKIIYKKLFAAFGPQHWWPAIDGFEVILGAILTQNTNWLNVEKALLALKKDGKLSAPRLKRMPLGKLALLIRSAGFYNLKALRIKEFLRFFFRYYHGSLHRMRLADTYILREQLLGVSGIGPETADSILLYALGKPIFVVDAYTRRILLRHRLIRPKDDYAAIQGLFASALKADAGLFNEYHALLVKLGKDYCLKNKPKCKLCPLNDQKTAFN